jgi:hypothetical protein
MATELAVPQVKTFSGMSGAYTEIATRDSQVLGVSLVLERYHRSSFILRFAVRSSDGNFGQYSFLNFRALSKYRIKNEAGEVHSTDGIRLDKLQIPVSGEPLSLPRMIKFCRDNDIFLEIAAFLYNAANHDGFQILYSAEQFAALVDNMISGEADQTPITNAFALPSLHRHEPHVVNAIKHSSHDEDSDEDDSDEDED